MIDELLAQFADEAIENGKILNVDRFKLGDKDKVSYFVEYLGRKFYFAKTNGEWTYFHECIEGGSI